MTKEEVYTHLHGFNNPYFKVLPYQVEKEGVIIQSTVKSIDSAEIICEGIHFIVQTNKCYLIIMCYGQVRAIHKTQNSYTLYLPEMDEGSEDIDNRNSDPKSGLECKFTWHDNRLSFGADYRSYVPYFFVYNRFFASAGSKLRISQESFTYEKKIIPYRQITGIRFTSEKMDIAIQDNKLISLPYTF